MISYRQYCYLDAALKTRPTVRPDVAAYPLDDGHTPAHLKCQVTAMHLEKNYGWRAQIGIQWLDKRGCLLPWPHVINWVDDRLTDFSNPILERKLGFTLIGNDVDMANALTASVGDPEIYLERNMWVDPLLQGLHSDWFVKLNNFCISGESRFDPLRKVGYLAQP
jgi:hypothetical protein